MSLLLIPVIHLMAAVALFTFAKRLYGDPTIAKKWFKIGLIFGLFAAGLWKLHQKHITFLNRIG